MYYIYSKGFVEQLPLIAAEKLQYKLGNDERHILQWVLGLTDKATQNVLRDNIDSINNYRDNYLKICKEVVSACESEYGKLEGTLALNLTKKAEINWSFVIELLGTVGLIWQERGDPATPKGGANTNNQSSQRLQPEPQRAC